MDYLAVLSAVALGVTLPYFWITCELRDWNPWQKRLYRAVFLFFQPFTIWQNVSNPLLANVPGVAYMGVMALLSTLAWLVVLRRLIAAARLPPPPAGIRTPDTDLRNSG